MNLDPTIRQSFWSVLIGMLFTLIGTLGINPSTIQRFLSLPTYKDVKWAILIFAIGNSISKIVCAWIGLIIFTTYMDCDPFLSKKIQRMDQLLPYYLLDVLGNLKGLSGLFVAGVCGAALSSMSTSINTLSLTIYEDFIKSRLPSDTSNAKINLIIKGIVVTSGVLCFIFIFLIEKLGGVVQISISFFGVTCGPLVGITTLGMLFPIANKHGALWGGVTSFIMTGIFVFGAQAYTLMGRVKPLYKSQSIDNCSVINSTTSPLIDPEQPPLIFQISFFYYTFIGAGIALIVGLLVSWLTRKKDDPIVHRDLLSPLVHRFLPNEDIPDKLFVYDSVEKALLKVKNAIDDNQVDKVSGS